MVEKARLQEIVASLNEAMGDVTPYKLGIVPPEDIQPVERNAHFMSKRTYDQLVANISQDKNLSSLPFCWLTPDGVYVCLSGNHRVKAAVGAGVPLILILYTDEDMSESERIAVQLSHNAIVGEDNPSILQELWKKVDRLDLKVYSGLDEEKLKTIPTVHVQQVGAARLRFESLTLLFVPSEVARIGETVNQVAGFKGHRWAADVGDFDRFFDLLLEFKEAANVLNTSTAIRMMIGIVGEWMETNAESEGEKGEN